jgi:hypothetical protein
VKPSNEKTHNHLTTMVGRRLLGRKATEPVLVPAGGARTSTIIDEKISELKAAQKTHSGKGKPPGGTAIVLPMWSPKRFAKWTTEQQNNSSADAAWSSEEVKWPGEEWWLRQGGAGGSAEEEQTENHHQQQTTSQEGIEVSFPRQTTSTGVHQQQQPRRNSSDLAFAAVPLSTLHQHANTFDASQHPKSSLVPSAGSTTRDNPKSSRTTTKANKEQTKLDGGGGKDDIDHMIIDLTTSNTTRTTTSINDIRQVAKSGGLPMQVIEGILQPAAAAAAVDSSSRDIFPSPSPPPPPPAEEHQQTFSTSLFAATAAAAGDTLKANARNRGWQKKSQTLLPPPSSSNQIMTNHHLKFEQQTTAPQNKRHVFNRHQQPNKKETRFRDELDPIVSSRTPRAAAATTFNKTVFGNDFNHEPMTKDAILLRHGSHSPLLLLESSSSSSNGASAWFGGLLLEEEVEPVDYDQQQQDDSTTGVSSSSFSPEFSSTDDHNYRILIPGAVVAPLPTNNNNNNNNESSSATEIMQMKKRAFLASRREAAVPPSPAPAPSLRTSRGDVLFMEQIATKSPKRSAAATTPPTTDRRTPPVSNVDERLLDREIIEVDRILSALRPMVDRSGTKSSSSSSYPQGHTTSCPRPEHYHPLSPLGVRIDDQKRNLPCRADQREPEGDLLGILELQKKQPSPSPPEEKKPSDEKAAAAVHKNVRAPSKQVEIAKNPETLRSSSRPTEKKTMKESAVASERMTSPNDSLLDADSEVGDEKSSKPAHIPAKPYASSSGPSAAEQRDGAVSEQAIQGMNSDHRQSKIGPYCESECTSAFQPSLVRTEEEASSFCTNARSDLAIRSSYFAPPIVDINNWSKDSAGVEVQLKTFNNRPHHEQDECSLFSSIQSVVLPEDAVMDRMVTKEGAPLERKASNEEYKSWNPYTIYGGPCRDAQHTADNHGNESEWVPPMRRTHPTPHHDYWKSFSTIKTLGSFDSLSVIDEVDGVISDESRNLVHQSSRDAIERRREGDRRVGDRRNPFGSNYVSRYYPGMTQQPQLAPLPETPASSIWVNDCASQRSSMMQTASSVDNPSPLRTNLRAAHGKAGFVWKRGVWQPQTDPHIHDGTTSPTTSPPQMPTSDDEIPRPLADSVLYLMSPLLSGDTEDVTALTEDDDRTTLKGDDDATDAATNDCSFICGTCTWNLNGIFC